MEFNRKEIKRTLKKQMAGRSPDGYQSVMCEKLEGGGDGQKGLA